MNRKTYNGTERDLDNDHVEIREFKFTPDTVGKFIVVSFRYEQHIFYDALFGNQLMINGHKLKDDDHIYAVYKIDWPNDFFKSENNISYKVKLIPVGKFEAWCPNRSWYTSDIEGIINMTYDLFEENPLFDKFEDAAKFALKKNFELYPDNRSFFQKIKDKIFNK